jgi:hypothetical protein
LVAREERRLPKPVKQDDDLLVLHALPAYIHADLPGGDAPGGKLQALPFEDILVQQYQAGAESSEYSALEYWPE